MKIYRNSILKSAIRKRENIETESISKPSLRKELGNFWMETVRNQTKSPTPQRIPMGLTASERLQQLQESTEEDPRSSSDGNINLSTFPYRRSSVEGVAARRNQYLRETFRSQSPMSNGGGYSGRSTPINSTLVSRYVYINIFFY